MAFFRRLIRHRTAVLGATGVVVLVAVLGARRVRVDFSVEQFFLPSGPEREAFDAYRHTFPREDAQVTLFWQDARPPGIVLYRDMERAARLFEEAGLEDVRWIGNALVAESEGDAGLSLVPLLDSITTDNVVAARLARHRDDPLLRGFLWDAGQHVFALHGYLAPEQNHDAGRRAVEETLTERLAALRVQSAHLVLGGLPIARSRAPKLLARDLNVLAAAAVAISGVVLLYFLRHPLQVVLLLASVAPAYLCTVGLMGVLGKPISVLTSFIPVVVLVVGMSDAVHLVAEFRRRLAAAEPAADAVTHTFATLAVPCFYTSLTTAIGFGTLAGTGIGMVMDFGLFTALAILLTYSFTSTLLPVLLSFVRPRAFDDCGLSAPWIRRLVAAGVAQLRRRRRTVALSLGSLSVAGLILGLGLRVNTLLIDDINRRAAIMRDIRWIESRGFGLFQLVIHVKAGGAEPLHRPEALAWMNGVRDFMRSDPLVLSAFAPADLITPLAHAFDDTGGNEGVITSTEEAAQLLLLVEMADRGVVRSLYAQPEGEAQVIATVRDAGSVELQPFLDRVDAYLNAHPFPDGTAGPTGTVIMIQAFTARLLRNLVPSVALAMILICACVMWMFRSVRLGLLAILPNLIPLAVLLGAMRLGAFDLKPSTILVFSVAFGIAVDNSIHLLGRFLSATTQTPAVEAALEEALQAAGPALVMNTVVVVAGFAVLLASSFQVLLLIGLMTVVSAVAALAANLFVFPAIVAVAWRRAPARGALPRRLERVI
ncbi:MAG TPA: MMPL family transporter [Gemmatimonadales bacterium]|nr:MMPL family transporter [Gemmatimonadales bacterium]